MTDLEELLRRTISEQVELAITQAADLWHIEADPGQLEQVLVNLVVNARDAMPDGGTITIDTENVETDDGYAVLHPSLPSGRYVRLRVSDTGSGMAQSVLEHVFEPFFTTKPTGEGTGLGLPMAFILGIIQQAGGDIQLYSEIGIGTTCHVLLPVTDSEMSREDQAENHRSARERDRSGRRRRRRPARGDEKDPARNGYQVLTSSDGLEAIGAFVEAHVGVIDLLLTDVIMPKMLGKEVAAKASTSTRHSRALHVRLRTARARFHLGEEFALLEAFFGKDSAR